MRYLGGYGPAAVMDIQAWCGLTKLGAVVDRLRPRLRVFHDEAGRELFDLPDAERPDPDTPAPCASCPSTTTPCSATRTGTRMIGDVRRRLVDPGIPGSFRTFLVDGSVGGRWRVERERVPR